MSPPANFALALLQSKYAQQEHLFPSSSEEYYKEGISEHLKSRVGWKNYHQLFVEGCDGQ